jgi:hypothetical protein
VGITTKEDTQMRPKHNNFPLVGKGTFLQYGTVGSILILLIRLLRRACQVTGLLFFVSVLDPGLQPGNWTSVDEFLLVQTVDVLTL